MWYKTIKKGEITMMKLVNLTPHALNLMPAGSLIPVKK